MVDDHLRRICTAFEIEALKGVVSQDYLHLLVSTLPNMAPSEYNAKGKGEQRSFEKLPELKRRLGKIFLGKRVLLCHFRRVDPLVFYSDFWMIGLPPQIIKTNTCQTGNDKASRILGYRAVTRGMKTRMGSHNARH